MTYAQADSVKELTAPVNKVLEGLNVDECYKCQGDGMAFKVLPSRRKCPICNGTGKIKWKWQPKVGEWIRYKLGNGITIRLIRSVIAQKLLLEPATLYLLDAHSKGVTPILHWETIERVLEKAGYYMSLPTKGERLDLWVVGFSKFKFKGTDKEFRYYKNMYIGRGKSRQEAVYRAVIELGKEMK